MKHLPVRKHPRLKNWNYNNNGAYFVTLCVKDRHEMLGKIVGAGSSRPHIELSPHGRIVQSWIPKILVKYPCVVVDKFVVMPNHMHMILTLYTDGRDDPAPTIGNVLGYYKFQTTKEINIPGFWQRSYHDRIIRGEAEFQRIWQYIDENPARWGEDEYYR
jgi:REP element-mobilizing transposase RayT